MGAFDGFHAKVEPALVFLDGGVLRVCEWAGCPVAESSEVVFVSAKGVGVGGGFEGAEPLVDDGPNDVVGLHRVGAARPRDDGRLESGGENARLGR